MLNQRTTLFRQVFLFVLALLLPLLVLSACNNDDDDDQNEEGTEENQEDAENTSEENTSETLTIYSGRGEDLVGSIIEQYEEESGMNVEVKYGSTSELAATLLEEGDNSPADLFFAQDAGALGAVAAENLFVKMPSSVLNQVEAAFRDEDGEWVGITGRARVMVYNTEELSEEDLPDDIWGLCEEAWRGKIGWAPTNGSFQAFVTALRADQGEERAQEWLECFNDNDAQVYPKNTPIVEAVGNGEIQVGLVNHYYVFQFLAENADFTAANYSPRGAGVGSMINVAGAGILASSENQAGAQEFIEFLLSETGQSYFAEETNEYPLIEGVEINPNLTPLEEINYPDLDLNDLEDLEGTLELLQEVGLI